MSALDGVTNNSSLLTIINDLHGKEVLLETVDAKQYMGVFAACSFQDTGMQIGLKYAYKRSQENAVNLLPKKSETTTKMIFNFNEVVSVTSLLNEEKLIKGFATDRDYHGSKAAANGSAGEDELEMWECDDEGEEIEGPNSQTPQHMPDQRQRYARNGGWSVDEMFHANTKLGVESTFDDNLSQYTTAEVKGSDEDRRRAEKIAREIEGNAQSRLYSRLENDDDERDLDKETTEDDFVDDQGKKGQRGGYSHVAKNGRGGGAAATNRRAEAMKGGRPNGPPTRYGQGGSGQQNFGQQRGGGQYIPGQGKRPTGAEVQEQFNEWTMKEAGNRKETPGSGKVYENSSFKATKVLLESRPVNRTSTDKGNQQSGGAARRADDLRVWSQGFDLKGNKTETTPPSEKEKEPSTSESPVRSSAPAGNAWNKGPPTSLVSMGANNSHTPANPSSPVAGATPSVESQPVADAEQSPGPSATVENVSAVSEKDPNDSSSPVKDSGNDTLSAAETSDAKEDASAAGVKKFSFNPNAAVFTPRMPPTTPTPQLPLQQPQQMQQMTAVPIGPIPGSVVQSSMPPPGVMPAMPGQQMMWQGAVPQGYQLPPGQYAASYMMSAGGPTMVAAPISMAPPRSGVPAGQQAYVQANPRRSGAPPTSTVLVNPNPNQWQNQMVIQSGGMVPYNYPQYQMQGGSVPPQQYGGAPQMMQPVQQQMQQPQQQQVFQQQRFPQMGNFVMPPQPQQQPPQQGSMGGQQQRYPTPQHQGGHDGSSFPQGGPHGSAAASTGPGSQPPTPGPQPPQPVASPAQPGRGSPVSMSAPPPQTPQQQQFMHAPQGQQQMPPPTMAQQHQAMMAQQQQFYPAQNMYLYPSGQPLMMYNAPPMGPVHSSVSGAVSHEQPPHHMDGGMIQTAPIPQQQYVASDMHGNYVPAAGVSGGYYQPGYQQQGMHRQNSLPQTYVPPGAPPGMSQQPPNGGPQGGQPPPPQQQQSSAAPQQQ